MSPVDLLAHLRTLHDTTVQATAEAALAHLQRDLGVARLRMDRLHATGKVGWLQVARGGSPQAADETAFQAYAPDDPHQRAWLDGTAQRIDPQRMLYPLPVQGQTHAVLVLEDDQPLSDAIIARAEPAAQQLAFALEHAGLRELLQHQQTLATALKAVTDVPMLADVLAQTLTQHNPTHTVAVLWHETPPRLMPQAAGAAADSDLTAFAAWCQRTLADAPDDLVPDVARLSSLDEAAANWLAAQGATSAYIAALPDVTAPPATLLVLAPAQPILLDAPQRQFYRSVALQAAALLERLQQSQQTREALREARTLYALTRDLTRARDSAAVLRTLYEYVADEAVASIALVRITYTEAGVLDEIIVTQRINSDGLSQPETALSAQMDDSTRQMLVAYWAAIGDDLEILEDSSAARDDIPMLAMLRASGVGSAITLPIRSGEQRIAQLSVTWATPNQFSPRLLTLFQTAQAHIRLILQNLQLLRDTQLSASRATTQAHILQMLNELVDLANQQVDEHTLLDRATTVLLEATQLDHVAIGMVQPHDDTIRIVSEAPEMGSVGSTVEAARTVRETRRAVLITDVAQDERLEIHSRDVLVNMGVHSVALLPMFDLSGELLGSVGLDSFAPLASFDADRLEIAQTIVSELGLAIQKQRLLQTAQDQNARMRQITAFSQGVQAQIEAPNIISMALDTFADLVPHQYFSVALYDRDATALRLAAHRHDMRRQIALPGRIIAPDENAHLYRVWHTKERHYIPDLNASEAVHPLKAALRCLVSLPLVSGGTWLGVVEIGAVQLNRYSDADLLIMEQMSNQLAVALNNADAYARSQRVAHNKALANDIISQLQQQTEIETILKITVKELGQALGAKHARIRLGMDAPDDAERVEEGR